MKWLLTNGMHWDFQDVLDLRKASGVLLPATQSAKYLYWQSVTIRVEDPRTERKCGNSHSTIVSLSHYNLWNIIQLLKYCCTLKRWFPCHMISVLRLPVIATLFQLMNSSSQVLHSWQWFPPSFPTAHPRTCQLKQCHTIIYSFLTWKQRTRQINLSLLFFIPRSTIY